MSNNLTLITPGGISSKAMIQLTSNRVIDFSSMEQLEGLVSAGLVPNAGRVRKFGRNPATANLDDIWVGAELGAGYENKSHQVTAFTAWGCSSSAGDTDIDIVVSGLDENGEPQDATFSTDASDGTTGALIPGSWLEISRAYVNDTTEPGGNISIGKDEPAGGVHSGANLQAYILQGSNQTEQASWRVPTGYTFYLKEWRAGSKTAGVAKTSTIQLLAYPPGYAERVKSNLHLYTFGQSLATQYMGWEAYSGGTQIDIHALEVSASHDIWAEFYGIYVKDLS